MCKRIKTLQASNKNFVLKYFRCCAVSVSWVTLEMEDFIIDACHFTNSELFASRASGHGIIKDCSFKNSTDKGGIYMQHCYNVFFTGSNVIAHNINIHSGRGINLFNSKVIFNGKCSVFNNSAHQHGGGIYAGNSNILFKEECSVFNNMAAKNGGGMSVEYSNITFQRVLLFFNNSAHKDGGGIFVEHRMLNFLGNVTIRDCFAPHAGGGIASIYSHIKFWGNLNLIGNAASERNPAGGGGISVWEGVINFTGDLVIAENHAGGLSFPPTLKKALIPYSLPTQDIMELV